jgi:hypothetical protein
MIRAATRDVAPTTQTTNGWRAEVINGSAPARMQREQELLESGVALPFASRSAVGQLSEYPPSYFLSVLDVNNRCVGGFAVHARRAPLIPSYKVLRVDGFGSSMSLSIAETAIAGLVKWAVGTPRILRLSVEIFAFDAGRRREIGGLLADHGFRRMPVPNGYRETLVTDLNKSEAELFAGLHHSARRKIRQLDKHPLALRTITDPSYSDRMNALLQETFARTGAEVRARNWSERIELSRQHPDLSRIIGLFRTDLTGPASLLAYAWGCHSGDHVFYSEAASTRATGDQRIALAYGVMWDLIQWAKRTGATWFDYGGITRGTHTDEDPLGGISDFKRYFAQDIVEVREEWVLDTHSWEARLAAAIHKRLRGL